MPWSPSRIGLAERHCNKALDYSADNVPYDRSVFGAGVAAHHVLQAVGEYQEREGRDLETEEYEAVAANVLRHLVSEGRTFHGHKEPPLNPARAAIGMELALEYLDFYPLPQGAKFELALAVDRDWKPVPWSERWFGCIVDVLYEHEDFATEALALVVEDYKSSWQAKSEELETLQRKAQGLCALAHFPNVDEVRLKVVNLRTLQQYSNSVPADSPVLGRWKLEIETVIEALEGDRIASPGAGCYNCPFLLACPEGQDYFERSEIIWQHGSDEEKAIAYALAVSMVGKLRNVLKPVVGEGTIQAGTTEVGYVLQKRDRAKDGAWMQMWKKWESRNGDLAGFLALHNPTKPQIEAMAKKLWPEKSDAEKRAKFIGGLVEPDNRATFKVIKTK